MQKQGKIEVFYEKIKPRPNPRQFLRKIEPRRVRNLRKIRPRKILRFFDLKGGGFYFYVSGTVVSEIIGYYFNLTIFDFIIFFF